MKEVIFDGWGKWVESGINDSTTYELGLEYKCVGILAMSSDDEFRYDNGLIELKKLTKLYRCLTNPKCHFKELITLFEKDGCNDYPAFNSEIEYGLPINQAEFPTFLIRKILDIRINERSENLSETPAKETNTAPIIKKEKPYSKRDNQINVICNIGKQLKYDLMAIPEGGKAAIKTECLKITPLFTLDGFLKAWQEANRRKLISMQDKEKYL